MRGIIIVAALAIGVAVGVCGCGDKRQAVAPARPAGVPHVVFVNVGEAVPTAVFEQAARTVREHIRVNIRYQRLAVIDPRELVGGRGVVERLLGADVCVAVFIVSDPGAVSYLAQPGTWSLVNVHSLRKDGPSDELYRERVSKILLKGLGHAAGVGSNPDPRCVMYHKSFQMAGLDATSTSYGPYAYFPLHDTLRMISGDAVFEPLDPIDNDTVRNGSAQ
jgi:hypothetical protein